jgi:hypothetical protein
VAAKKGRKKSSIWSLLLAGDGKTLAVAAGSSIMLWTVKGG